MDAAKKAKLEAAGYTVGTVTDFLQLTPCEAEIVETKVALTHQENTTQEQVAEGQDWTFTTDEGEVIVLDDSPIAAGRMTYLMAEPALSRMWDTPEEDEAWRDL